MSILVVTGSRADWRLVEPVVRAAGADARLLVTGTHLSERHGATVREIEAADLGITARVPILDGADTPLHVAQATGRGVCGCAEVIARINPRWVLVAGDRYESFAAGVAATMLGVPLAHLGGGETDVATNQDANLRNALTKLAQLHLASHELAAERLRALGEEAWRIHVVGLPSLDGIVKQAAAFEALVSATGLPTEVRPRGSATGKRFLLASFLPVTLRTEQAHRDLRAMLDALGELSDLHKLFVLSNGDAEGDRIDDAIRRWAAPRSDATLLAALPPALYLSALRHAACYVGNSSSGVIEAPVLGCPAVIVGERQEGRPTATTTVTLQRPTAADVRTAIRTTIAIRESAANDSPYGAGGAADRIVALLHRFADDPRLLSKRLVDHCTGATAVHSPHEPDRPPTQLRTHRAAGAPTCGSGGTR